MEVIHIFIIWMGYISDNGKVISSFLQSLSTSTFQNAPPPLPVSPNAPHCPGLLVFAKVLGFPKVLGFLTVNSNI